MKLYFSDGKKEKIIELNGLVNPMQFLNIMHIGKKFKLVKCEGEGELAEYYKVLIEKKKQNPNYEPDPSELIKIAMKGMV